MPNTIAINNTPRQLKVGGFVPFSTTDYPGKLAAVVFVQGCPWQCTYCHNPHLQTRTEESPTPWSDVLAMLQRRAGLLDAVVFSGGEPTMDPALEEAIRDVRALGFAVGLHTSGAYPKRLIEILPLIDWIGIDAKAPFASYEHITGVSGSGKQALACAEAVIASGITHEFRTTIHPNLISDAALLDLAQTLSTIGVQNFVLQVFRARGCDKETLASVGNDYPSEELVAQIEEIFKQFTLRKT
jgi:pyruvate formate lyase activating enzyme